MSFSLGSNHDTRGVSYNTYKHWSDWTIGKQRKSIEKEKETT